MERNYLGNVSSFQEASQRKKIEDLLEETERQSNEIRGLKRLISHRNEQVSDLSALVIELQDRLGPSTTEEERPTAAPPPDPFEDVLTVVREGAKQVVQLVDLLAAVTRKVHA